MKCYEVQSVVWTEYPRLFNGTALCTSKLSKWRKLSHGSRHQPWARGRELANDTNGIKRFTTKIDECYLLDISAQPRP